MAVTIIDFETLLDLTLVIGDHRRDILRPENCRAVKRFLLQRFYINVSEHTNLWLVNFLKEIED